MEVIMTDRIEKLRESLFVKQFPLCYERTRLFTESFKEGDAEPIILRRANAFANVLDKINIFIEDGELIVGNTASKPRGFELNPLRGAWISAEEEMGAEVGEEWFLRSRAEGGERELFELSEEDVKEIRELSQYWQKRLHKTWLRRIIDKRYWDMPDATIIRIGGFLGRNMNQFGGFFGGINGLGLGGVESYIPDYGKGISRGLNSIIEEAEQEIEKARLADPVFGRRETMEKLYFFNAVIMAHKAAIRFAKRFSALATEMAAQEADPTRKKELERIASICDWVPANPPRDFYEALQSFWFLHLLIQPGHSVNPGRFDQYMYPYYKKDKEEGRITEEEALELLQCLRIKHSQLQVIWETEQGRFSNSGFAQWQQVVLGGQKPDGTDGTNELSYLMIEAAMGCPTVHPALNVRVWEKTPDDFMLQALELVKTGIGFPAFFSDDNYIKFWLERGAPLPMARDWALAGCVYTNIAGHTNELAGEVYNCAYYLVLALNNGRDPKTGKQVGPKTGEFEDFESFDDLMNAYKEQVNYILPIAAQGLNLWVLGEKELQGQPFLSPLMGDAIKRGKDMTEDSEISIGAADAVGMINVADSMAAIKKVVFDDKKITKKELKAALEADFQSNGYDKVHQILLAAPKYGNDDDYVDLIAKELYAFWTDKAHETDFCRGKGVNSKMVPDGLSVTYHQYGGAVLGATPDGRHAGEALADGTLSAMRGRDTHGPTALLNSAAKIDQIPYIGILLNMKFHPSVLKTREDLLKLSRLIRAYFAQGGRHVQFNVVSRETLLDAQKHPENYRDLIVRVAGYSAYFTDLDRQVQNEIIERTEMREL
jgi:pyruvate formate-lyase/glycerol dehydratase family glycyl radical enzyme